MKKYKGGGMLDQKKLLIEFEDYLGLSVGETASVLGVPYSTYKNWKNGTNVMNGSVIKLIEIMKSIAGTNIGKDHGV